MDIFAKYTEKFVAKVIDEADALIIYSDHQENISICNKKIEAITGKKKEQIIGNKLLSILYPGDSNTRKQQMFKAVIDNSLAFKRPNSFEDVITDGHNKER